MFKTKLQHIAVSPPKRTPCNGGSYYHITNLHRICVSAKSSFVNQRGSGFAADILSLLRSSSTHDALIIFECVRRGILPKISRRLREDERRLIRSGSVFVFDEKQSGIKRWTDGLLWSPSRILWNFLVSQRLALQPA